MNMMTVMERWAPVPGFPRHEVSTLGNVRAVPERRVLRPIVYRNTRLHYVHEYDSRDQFVVAEMLLRAHVGPPPCEGAQVVYLNGDRLDVRLDNLVWSAPKSHIPHVLAQGWAKTERDVPVSLPTVAGRAYLYDNKQLIVRDLNP